MPREVVIDDSDRRIRYIGPHWFRDGSQDGTGASGSVFNHTQHGTDTNRTSISVIGSLDRVKVGKHKDPSWKCYLNNVLIGGSDKHHGPKTPINNAKLCGSDGLVNGRHTLVVNITSAGNPFWVDYLIVTPSSNTSSSAVSFVDNRDTGVFCDKHWNPHDENDVSAILTTTPGSTLKFNFTGTALSWVGIVPNKSPHHSSNATYSVDGATPSMFPLHGIPPSKNKTLTHQVFFSLHNLSAGPHSLAVTYNGTNNTTPLALQYLLVTNPSQISPMSTSHSNHNHLTGTIVGSIIGGLTFILLILVFICWKVQKRYNLLFDTAPGGVASVTPFTPLYQPDPETLSHRPLPGRSFITIGSRKPIPFPPSGARSGGILRAFPADPSRLGYTDGYYWDVESRPHAIVGPVPSRDDIRGIRFERRGGFVQDVPPLYTSGSHNG